MRVLVDTGVFSASLSRRRRSRLEQAVGSMAGNQVFLATVTVSELRYGALVAGWGDTRRGRLEEAIKATRLIVPSLLATVEALSPRDSLRWRAYSSMWARLTSSTAKPWSWHQVNTG